MRLTLSIACFLTVAIPRIAPAQTDSSRWAGFIATTDSLRQAAGVPGLSYAVVERGRVVAQGGLGYSDVASRTAATDSTLYPIASLTKPIAAVVLFQLVQAGKLDLDARMSVILRDYRFNPRILGYAARCANIAMLATLDDPEIAPYRQLFEDYLCKTQPITVRHHLTHMAQGVPGTAYRYNGFLYGMLRPVAEAVSGESFWTLIQNGVLRPAGMYHTTYSPEAADSSTRPAVARPYRRDSAGQMAPSSCQDCNGLNAGSGIVSSVSDLARFAIALQAGTLLPEALSRAMLTPARTNGGVRSPYANGWFVQDLEGKTVYWHYGHLPNAYSGLLIIVPGREAALILLGNSDGLSAGSNLGQGDLRGSPFARAFLAAVKTEAPFQSTAPILDGTIAPGEWSGATRSTGSNGLEIFTLDTDSALYVAVRGPGDGYPHIALVAGDTVLLLHASAALGTARFAGAGELKALTQPFTFGVRGTALTGPAQAERDSFYAREGWMASTIRMGRAGETEFKITRSRLGPGRRIAVAYWSEAGGVARWPAALEDAVTEERVVQGFMPETARFRPGEWGTAE